MLRQAEPLHTAALLWMERSNFFYFGELPSLAMDSETKFKHGVIQKILILVNNVLAMKRQPGKAKHKRELSTQHWMQTNMHGPLPNTK